MKIQWKKLLLNIPSKIDLAPRITYQIVWQKDLTDTKGKFLFGITDLDNKLITVRMDMPAKVTMETVFHEMLHGFDEEYDIGLTETQVLKLEKILPTLVKLGLFKGNK